MSKKERLSAFNRSNILSAAKQLFFEKGIAQTTMDDISKEADYSKSTVYAYFKSKEEIYNHIILENFEILKNDICEVLRSKPGFPDGYFAICNALMENYSASPLFFESILSGIKIPDDESETVLVQIYEVGDEINGVIEHYLNYCVENKYINLDMPPLQATLTLWAGITGIIMFAHNKNAYIGMATGTTKECFMQNGFRLLLKSIMGGK
ncbi:MAG: TetR/AcrR family transcriptional regulator [Lachnospiraceae bacterium]|jgi:AcrR family transcriptional regulator|nr:TetR/AcrR family transcriptional regulator [Lachnospiraceae bacterium]